MCCLFRKNGYIIHIHMDDMYSNHNPDVDIFCMKLVKLGEACEYLLECTKKTMSRVPIIPKLLCALGCEK